MGEKIKSEVSKLSKSKSTNLLEKKIEKYMRIPIYMFIILIIINGCVYAFDCRCGVIVSVGMVVFIFVALDTVLLCGNINT